MSRTGFTSQVRNGIIAMEIPRVAIKPVVCITIIIPECVAPAPIGVQAPCLKCARHQQVLHPVIQGCPELCCLPRVRRDREGVDFHQHKPACHLFLQRVRSLIRLLGGWKQRRICSRDSTNRRIRLDASTREYHYRKEFGDTVSGSRPSWLRAAVRIPRLATETAGRL